MKKRTFDGALLDVRTAALFLGTSEKSLRWMIEKGTVPVKNLRGRVVFKRCDLERFVDRLPVYAPRRRKKK